MSVGIARSFPDPNGAPSFMGTTSGVSIGGGVDGDEGFSGTTGLAIPFRSDAGAGPVPPPLANLNRKPGLGAWVSGLMVSRLADEAAIFDGVCIGVPMRVPNDGAIVGLELLFMPKPRGRILVADLGEAR